jgi:hypothetical protein
MENAGASSCSYTETTSTGSSDFVDLGTGTSCAAWTVVSNGPGTISAQGTNDHRLVYTNMPPGNYKIEINGLIAQGNVSGACTWRLSDGTNSYQPQVMGVTTTVETYVPGLNFHVTVTTAATRTYKLQAADSMASSGCYLGNSANYGASWKIYRFPTTSETAYTADKTANSWSGYHDSTCSWARTNAAYGDPTADASCALVERTNNNFGTVSTSGSVLPAITFTPSRAGRYYVCADFMVIHSALSFSAVQLLAGSTVVVEKGGTVAGISYGYAHNLCGIVVATSTAAVTLKIQTSASLGSTTIQSSSPYTTALNWSIFQIDQSFPAPNLVNSVVSPSSGVEQVTRADLSCTASSSVTRQSGSWVSLGNRSGNDCVGTITTGTFSSTPSCVANLMTDQGSNLTHVNIYTVSSTGFTIGCKTQSGASTSDCGDYTASILCIGPK